MNKKWKIITVIGLTTILTAGYQWGIPAIINLPKHKTVIEKSIQKNTGYNLKLGNARLSMGTFPSVWVKSNNISILNKDKSKALSIDNPKIKLKLFPLLFKKIEIAHIYSDKENINFTYTKDKKFLLGDSPIKFEKKGKYTLKRVHLDLGKYNITLDDKLNNKKIALNGEYLKNGKYKANEELKFGTEGKILVENSSTPYMADIKIDLPIDKFNDDKLKIDGYIKDFDLSLISPYMPIFTKGVIQNTKGNLNFYAKTIQTKYGHKLVNTTIKTTDLEVKGKNKPEIVTYKDDLFINTNFETIANGINFKNTQLKSKDFQFTINGKLGASGSKIPSMDFTLDVKPTRLEKICQILPWFREIPKEMDFYKFKEFGVFGNGKANLHFVGDGKRPEVFGNININNAYVTKPYKTAPQGAKIDMEFIGKIMNLDVFFPTDKDQNVTVKGFVKTDGSKYSELNIKSTNAIDMGPAQEVLNPLHDMLKFKIGPVPIMKLTGLATIDVSSKGKKVDPHLFGKMNFRNATASFNDIHNLTLKNASGEILFHNTEIPFKTTRATINGLPASIYGKCNVSGDLNIFAETKGQKIPNIIKVINTSKDMEDVQEIIKPFTQPDGIGDLFLNIYGNAQDVTEVVFNKDIFAKGKITLHNATTLLKDTYIPFKNVNGVVNFDKKNADYDVTGFINNSKLHVYGTADDKDMDLIATTEHATLLDIFNTFHPEMYIPFKNEIGKINVSLIAKYKGIADTDNLDYDKIIVDGKILSNMNTHDAIKVNSGDFNIRNSTLTTDVLKGLFNGNPYKLSFSGTDVYDYMKIKDAEFDFSNFNISSLNEIVEQLEIPEKYKAQLDNITDIKGLIDIKGTIKDGNIYSDTNLSGISFTYKPYNAIINVLSGKANMRGNTLYLGKVNSKVSSMPVYLNGNIRNILTNPNLDIYLAGKFNQEFFDKFINEKSVYPVKLKGDANFNTKLNGTLNNLHTISSLNVKENSSIYYMGATLAGAPSGSTGTNGIATNPVLINLNANIAPDKLKINSLDYNQTITSQNRKISEQKQLTMSGVVSVLKDNILKFDNLKIKTFEPTDAKIFNIILKKPVIKQGIFMTDMTINGTSLQPYAIGNLSISSIDIPLFDSTIRDIDIDMQKDFINLDSKGVILTNDISLIAKIANKTQIPYIIEDFKIQADALDLNVIANRFNDYDTDKLHNKHPNIDSMPLIPNMIIKNGNIFADKILIKKAEATDFKANVTLGEDNILHINNYAFNLAKGTVNGDISTNFETMASQATMNIKNADAETISENFFDMRGQMFGHVTGDLKASCIGTNSVECLNTLNGEGQFNVYDGRMPKLGSLEYLLKAANLVTGGLTGVSINGIIDLITPLKTGNFEKISGDIKVQNGIANDINVYSYGKELNMYMTGSYNLSTLVADMNIYGSLSKNFSTILGRIGNTSLNRLLNTIPGININEIKPETTSNINKIPNFNKDNTLRVFKADIFGDINGSNYVKSFRWIKH